MKGCIFYLFNKFGPEKRCVHLLLPLPLPSPPLPQDFISKLLSARFTFLKNNGYGWTDGPTDQPTDGPTDGRTKPLIEMRGRI